MSRLSKDQLVAAAIEKLQAEPDPSGEADLVAPSGAILIAASPEDMKATFKKAKKMKGYKWVLINRQDLFAANTLSLGSKAGIYDENGAVLKNADIPRKKI